MWLEEQWASILHTTDVLGRDSMGPMGPYRRSEGRFGSVWDIVQSQ